MNLYQIDGEVKTHLVFTDNLRRERNTGIMLSLKVVAPDVEEAIRKFKREAEERFNGPWNSESFGHCDQIVTGIIIGNVLTLENIDLC